MQSMKCKVQEISVRHGEFGERIGKGKVVDFDRVVSHRESKDGRVAITLGELLQGREDCFEAVNAAPSADHQAPTPLDVDDEPQEQAQPSGGR